MQPQAHSLHSRFTSHINIDNQFYVHLISDDSINYFPSNEPWQFTCMLADVLILSGRCYVGLVEVEYSHKIKGNTRPFHITVSCDICADTIVGNRKCNVLRYVQMSQKNSQKRMLENLGTVHYLPANKQEIDRVKICLNVPGYSAEQVFASEPVRCTLHFTKSPPLIL